MVTVFGALMVTMAAQFDPVVQFPSYMLSVSNSPLLDLLGFKKSSYI